MANTNSQVRFTMTMAEQKVLVRNVAVEDRQQSCSQKDGSSDDQRSCCSTAEIGLGIVDPRDDQGKERCGQHDARAEAQECVLQGS
jgi:hypothetical protein